MPPSRASASLTSMSCTHRTKESEGNAGAREIDSTDMRCAHIDEVPPEAIKAWSRCADAKSAFVAGTHFLSRSTRVRVVCGSAPCDWSVESCMASIGNCSSVMDSTTSDTHLARSGWSWTRVASVACATSIRRHPPYSWQAASCRTEVTQSGFKNVMMYETLTPIADNIH